MTAQPTQSSRRSRRALLAGALGGVGAVAAAALGRQQPARADVGDPVIIGAVNTGGGTSIQSDDATRSALSLLGGVHGLDAHGDTRGVSASSTRGNGVFGTSQQGFGVQATSHHAHALIAQSFGTRPNNSRGVWGSSQYGQAVYGDSELGWAAYFKGRLFTSRYIELREVAGPEAPEAGHARFFVRDNGAGKSQLCVRFASGAVQVVAREP